MRNKFIFIRVILYCVVVLFAIGGFYLEKGIETAVELIAAKHGLLQKADFSVWPLYLRLSGVVLSVPGASLSAGNVEISASPDSFFRDPFTVRGVTLTSFSFSADHSLKAFAAPAYPAINESKETLPFEYVLLQDGKLDYTHHIPLLPELHLSNIKGFITNSVVHDDQVVARIKAGAPAGAALDLKMVRYLNNPVMSILFRLENVPLKDNDSAYSIALDVERDGPMANVVIAATGTEETPLFYCAADVRHKSESAVKIEWNGELRDTLNGRGTSQIRLIGTGANAGVYLSGEQSFEQPVGVFPLFRFLPFISVEHDISVFPFNRRIDISKVILRDDMTELSIRGSIDFSRQENRVDMAFSGRFVKESFQREKHNFILAALIAELSGGTDYTLNQVIDIQANTLDLDSRLISSRLNVSITGNARYDGNVQGAATMHTDSFDSSIVPEFAMFLHVPKEGLFFENVAANGKMIDNKFRFETVTSTVYGAPLDIRFLDGNITEIEIRNAPARRVIGLLYPPHSNITGTLTAQGRFMPGDILKGAVSIKDGVVLNVNILERIMSSMSNKIFVKKVFIGLGRETDRFLSTPFSEFRYDFVYSRGTLDISDAQFEAVGFMVSVPELTVNGDNLNGRGELYLLSMNQMELIMPNWMKKLSGSLPFDPLKGFIKLPFTIKGTVSSPRLYF
ncbi:MAG: hypothetical protein AB1454_01330 [Candidatus Auribacterota bacterium]